jgi:dTDP-4-amino-4,6-dideoxygalactose transaminase
MIGIHKLSKKYGFKIIEDASHAIGASYDKIKVGSCKHSDITVFSFHPVKIITTAEGGMALTNDIHIAEKIIRLRTHGINNDKTKFQGTPKNMICNYQQTELGFNYRMNDIQAALGLNQIKRLDKYVLRRHEIAMRYDDELKNLPFITPFQARGVYSSYHLYPICMKHEKLKKTQKEIFNNLRENDIGINLHYMPVYLQPYYQSLKFKEGYCLNAEAYFKSAISIPIFSSLTDENQTKVIETISKL